MRRTGKRLLAHFLSDNTSPETCSFNVVSLAGEKGGGRALAREAARRFLLTQLLLAYANRRYELEATGQKAAACHAPTPPTRQRELNELISDAFYRELFMNPCLSGWDRGEDKSAYMGMCHEVLSRSQLNGVKKLRDAGIILNNLVVMPSTSNLSLANNGVHVSIGSKRLTALAASQDAGFGPADEKYFGDLAIKIMEHFLPLFVGTYSAAPYRLGFQAFHPETALGFLPHELDFTHLRMLWRRWKGKANLRALGVTFTPCGPGWLDSMLSRVFHLRGDWVPDYRLLDYLVFLLSTHRSPSLSGALGNSERLKRDLASLGVFDMRMSLYLLIKLREQAVMGFSGFEARQYSLFERFGADMAVAVTLQSFLCAFAFRAMASGRFSHADILTTRRWRANGTRWSSTAPSDCPPSSCTKRLATASCAPCSGTPPASARVIAIPATAGWAPTSIVWVSCASCAARLLTWWRCSVSVRCWTTWSTVCACPRPGPRTGCSLQSCPRPGRAMP